MLKIRRPLGRLIFNMGIAIPGKTVFLIETAPRIQEFVMDCDVPELCTRYKALIGKLFLRAASLSHYLFKIQTLEKNLLAHDATVEILCHIQNLIIISSIYRIREICDSIIFALTPYSEYDQGLLLFIESKWLASLFDVYIRDRFNCHQRLVVDAHNIKIYRLTVVSSTWYGYTYLLLSYFIQRVKQLTVWFSGVVF